MSRSEISVAFLHPDLGLGGRPHKKALCQDLNFQAPTEIQKDMPDSSAGAERLVVDAAAELVSHGAEVNFRLAFMGARILRSSERLLSEHYCSASRLILHPSLTVQSCSFPPSFLGRQ